MIDLINRLEKATEADREFDCAIYVVLGASPPEHESLYWTAPGGLNRHYEALIPRYTESLDAALTLAPESFDIAVLAITPNVRGTIVGTAQLKVGGVMHSSGGATPAIALCIAALKARAAHTTGHSK